MTLHIARNHMDMCRLSGLQDDEYRKVAAALTYIQQRITEGSADTASPGL